MQRCSYFTTWIPRRKFKWNDRVLYFEPRIMIIWMCQRNRWKIPYVQSCCKARSKLNFFSIGHTGFRPRRAAPRRVASRRFALAITLAPVVGGGYQFPRQCDPPILPTTIKRLLSSNVYGYGAVITFPDLQRASRMDTAKANFTPSTLHIVRLACDIYYDNFCAQKRFTVIYARPWN